MWRNLSMLFIKWIGKTVTYDQAMFPLLATSSLFMDQKRRIQIYWKMENWTRIHEIAVLYRFAFESEINRKLVFNCKITR